MDSPATVTLAMFGPDTACEPCFEQRYSRGWIFLRCTASTPSRLIRTIAASKDFCFYPHYEKQKTTKKKSEMSAQANQVGRVGQVRQVGHCTIVSVDSESSPTRTVEYAGEEGEEEDVQGMTGYGVVVVLDDEGDGDYVVALAAEEDATHSTDTEDTMDVGQPHCCSRCTASIENTSRTCLIVKKFVLIWAILLCVCLLFSLVVLLHNAL